MTPLKEEQNSSYLGASSPCNLFLVPGIHNCIVQHDISSDTFQALIVFCADP